MNVSYFQDLGGSLLDSPGNSIITTTAITTTLAKRVLLLAAMVSARFLFRGKKKKSQKVTLDFQSQRLEKLLKSTLWVELWSRGFKHVPARTPAEPTPTLRHDQVFLNLEPREAPGVQTQALLLPVLSVCRSRWEPGPCCRSDWLPCRGDRVWVLNVRQPFINSPAETQTGPIWGGGSARPLTRHLSGRVPRVWANQKSCN